MDKTSEAILALKPVTFHYKKELDPDGISQFGLVAEDVEKVNPDLIARDEDKKPFTVRYEAINVMLLNEFIKEHRKVQELESTLAKQEATIAQQQKDFHTAIAQQRGQMKMLTAKLEEQAVQIEKVTAQVQMSIPAHKMVQNR